MASQFPTGTGSDAGRWCPDGQGTGSHIPASEVASGSPPTKKHKSGADAEFKPETTPLQDLTKTTTTPAGICPRCIHQLSIL